MKKYLWLLIFAASGASAQTYVGGLASCQFHYAVAASSIDRVYGHLSAEQQIAVDPVRSSLASAITFLQGREGAAGYEPLCTSDVIDTLTNVVSRVQGMVPLPLSVIEGKAERQALLAAARKFLR